MILIPSTEILNNFPQCTIIQWKILHKYWTSLTNNRKTCQNYLISKDASRWLQKKWNLSSTKSLTTCLILLRRNKPQTKRLSSINYLFCRLKGKSNSNKKIPSIFLLFNSKNSDENYNYSQKRLIVVL